MDVKRQAQKKASGCSWAATAGAGGPTPTKRLRTGNLAAAPTEGKHPGTCINIWPSAGAVAPMMECCDDVKGETFGAAGHVKRCKPSRRSAQPGPPAQHISGMLLGRLARLTDSLRAELALTPAAPSARCGACEFSNPISVVEDNGGFRCRRCFKLNCMCQVCEATFVSRIPQVACEKHEGSCCGKCERKTLHPKTGTKFFECTLCYVNHVACYYCEKIILETCSVPLAENEALFACAKCTNKMQDNSRRKRR